MLPPNQIEQIKKQIIQQIELNFPEEKKESSKQYIESMNVEQLEEFLKKNKLMTTNQEPVVGTGGSGEQGQQCVFCSIVSGDIQSYKIDENKDSVAVLEINPISKAHTLIIPKQHFLSSEKIPQTVFSLAKKIAEKIKTKFKPKDITISSSNLFGHEIINVLPIYENETLNSKRNKAKPEELEKIQKLLARHTKINKVIKKPRAKKLKEKIWLPKRIP